MRTRKEIEENKDSMVGSAFFGERLTIELLLDIRDLLTPSKAGSASLKATGGTNGNVN